MALSFLHFTDLHCGQKGIREKFPTVDEALRSDLRALHVKTGPWSLALFTGDLVFSGQRAQFDELDQRVGSLRESVSSGNDWLLLPCPGNHDLQRPKGAGFTDDDARVAEMLTIFRDEPSIRAEFWDTSSGRTSVGRALVHRCFAEWTRWFDRVIEPAIASANGTLVRGVLPGDWSCSLVRDGLRVGVVSLNTAFLAMGDAQAGELELGVQQLLAVTDNDPGRWCDRHDVRVLLTHHPIEWLHPEAQREFASDILGDGRFDLHLHGHMHEPGGENRQPAGAAAMQRRAQGPSLFGLEQFGSPPKEQRVHGYGLYRVRAEESGELVLESFPRIAQKSRANTWIVGPDLAMGARGDAPAPSPGGVLGRTPKRVVELSGSLHIKVTAQGNLSKTWAPNTLPIAGAPYDPKWYLARPKEETTLRQCLDTPGTPALVRGMPGIGKSWLVEHVLANTVTSGDFVVRSTVAHDLPVEDTFRSLCFDVLEQGPLGVELVRESSGANRIENTLKRHWTPSRSLEQRVARLIETEGARRLDAGKRLFWVLSFPPAPTVELTHRINATLRGIVESAVREPVDRVRIVMMESSFNPNTLRLAYGSSFNAVTVIDLNGLDEQTLLHDGPAKGIAGLDSDAMRAYGGHPMLIRAGLKASVALDEQASRHAAFAQFMTKLLQFFRHNNGEREAFNELLTKGTATGPAVERLIRAGLVVRDGDGAPRVAIKLLERGFRAMLQREVDG
jgi:hypothetical protein